LRRTAADRGLQVRVAIAGTRTAARLFVHYRVGITVIEPGCEAEMLASLPLSLMDVLAGSPNPKSQTPNPKSQIPNPPPSRDEVHARFGEPSPELVVHFSSRQA